MTDERESLAHERTEWAEDRTIMANERTYAGWMRTGLAAVGVGIGFNALFGKLEPLWLAKILATLFISCGIVIFYFAWHNSSKVRGRLSVHDAKPLRGKNMGVIAWLLITGSVGLIAALWIFDLSVT